MMNVMDFQQQWRNQMNGILTDMFAPTSVHSPMAGGMAGMYNTIPGMVDSPPPLHTLSLNPPTAYHHNPYYPWDCGQRCRWTYFV